MNELDNARAEFRDRLIAEGLLIPTGVDGLYGRSGTFEDIIDGIDGVVPVSYTHLTLPTM